MLPPLPLLTHTHTHARACITHPWWFIFLVILPYCENQEKACSSCSCRDNMDTLWHPLPDWGQHGQRDTNCLWGDSGDPLGHPVPRDCNLMCFFMLCMQLAWKPSQQSDVLFCTFRPDLPWGELGGRVWVHAYIQLYSSCPHGLKLCVGN